MLRKFVMTMILSLTVIWSTASASTEQIVEKVLPSVVGIGIAQGLDSSITVIGSGTIVTQDGYVLTVRHNVVLGDHLFVRLHTGQLLRATYYIADAHRDIAVLKINVPPEITLQPLEVGYSRDVRVGQQILTFGYPKPKVIEGSVATVSTGIISAVNRILIPPYKRNYGEDSVTIEEPIQEWIVQRAFIDLGNPNDYLSALIQFDAVINPGSSGGPLVTMDGKIVGLVQSMVTDTGSNVGLNFAIPVDEAFVVLILTGARSELNE